MAKLELPGYELYERLGRGGMATVYRAVHLNLDREVAIKVMDPGMNSDENFSERFIREARISARLTHPHILQIYDVNTFDGYMYIAMELLGAGELSDCIQSAMPQKQIYTIIRQMTEALDYAAENGYVHRDIKPSNILMRDPENFVLADFGIARAANSGTQMTQTGLMVGTPSYMSPEQAKGQEVDGRSDLYALGVLAYEMLTKTLPYESDSAVTTAVMHLTENIPTLPEHLCAYQDFLNKALAKLPDDRFQTGGELYLAFMDASKNFKDDQILTPGIEIPEQLSASEPIAQSAITSVAGFEPTRSSDSSSPAVSAPARPYRLEGSTQSQRLVSATNANMQQVESKSSGSALRIIAIVAVLAGTGFGGYTWWQEQQGGASKDQRAVTAELAKAFNAMNEDQLPVAASSFSKVLSMDNGNDAAEQGLNEVGALYTAAIDNAIADKDVDAARRWMLEYSGYFSGDGNLERLQAEIDLLSEEKNLAEVHYRRVQKLLSQVDESLSINDFAKAQAQLAQAVAINPEHPELEGRRSTIAAAEAEAAAYEKLWLQYTPAQREDFNTSIALTDDSLDNIDLEAAATALESARKIAADAPEIAQRSVRLEAVRAQVAQAMADEQARADNQLLRLQQLLSQVDASLEADNTEQAQAQLDEAAAIDPENPELEGRRSLLAKAQADAAAYEKRWSKYTTAQRDDFNASLAVADEALDKNDLDAAAVAIGTAENIAADAPELVQRVDRLETGRVQVAQAQAEEEARVDALIAKADAAANEIAADPTNATIALDAYQEVAVQYPNDTRVKKGLASVTGYYTGIAQNAAEDGDFEGARQALATAEALLPGSENVAQLMANLPDMELTWTEQQAAIAKRNEEERAAREQDEREQTEKTIASAEQSLNNGALDVAQKTYTEVAQSHPTLQTVKTLGRNLRKAYGDAARNQIKLLEFDAAQAYLAQGVSNFPDDPTWTGLEEEIETARKNSRRRLGAY